MPEISPEMAEKVLSADLRNVIKKVGDGAPLSTAEREMMQRYLASSAEVEDLAKARAASMLRRWATGSKFSKAELKELEAHFAGEVGGKKPTSLTADHYDHPLRVYAARIWPDKEVDSGVRTLKRWVKKGKTSHDFPPFDDLPRLAAWYERHHRYVQAPEELRRFEAEAESEAPDPEIPEAGEEGEEDDRLPAITLDINGEFTADEGLRQIRALVKATYKQMEIALERRQATTYRSLSREWKGLINTQRQWEKDILKIQEGKGEVLRTRVINSELVRIFTTTGQSFFNKLLKTLQQHAPHLSPEEQRRIALEGRDEVFTHLRGTRFESAWTPDSQS